MADNSRPPILNPHYEGVSPEEVAAALLRKWGNSSQLPESKKQSSTDEETEAA